LGVFSRSFYFRIRKKGVDFGLVCVYTYTQMKMKPKGTEAALLRKCKFALLEALRLPPEALPGSLALTHRRCGKQSCHCAQGQGHPVWTLTFMLDGKKRVERIPEEWVEWVRGRVEEGRRFKEDAAQILAANAQLLVLWRKERER
jgi:hypothetical protein